MRQTLVALVIGLLPSVVLAQDPTAVRQMFEAGEFRQVVEATTPSAPPAVVFLAGRSQERLAAPPQALELYKQLASQPAAAWQAIGASAQQLLQNQVNEALASARQATAADPNLPEAHYQLGLVLAAQQTWPEAASAFDRVVALSPVNAYGYYYSGLMHYRAGRPDQMAIQFERFLKLAPKAPERPEVVQIMRTVRGR